MNEKLRFSHIRVDRQTGVGLADFNLALNHGEVVLVTGMHQSGLACVSQLMRGEVTPVSGRIYVNERVTDINGYLTFISEEVFFIDGQKCLVGSMTCSDNIAIVTGRKSLNIFVNPPAVYEKTLTIIREVGLTISPDEKVSNLTIFEKYLLSIAKGISIGASILVMDMGHNQLDSHEEEHLLRVIKQLKEKLKITLLILSGDPLPMIEVIERIVLIHEGRDIKTYFVEEEVDLDNITQWIREVQVDYYLEDEAEYEFRHQPQKVGNERLSLFAKRAEQNIFLQPGEIGGIYDRGGFARRNFELTFKNWLERNEVEFQLNGQVVMPQTIPIHYIPENSGECLHSNLRLGDLILLPRYPKASSVIGGFNPKIVQQAENDFLELFHIPKKAYRADDLTKLERRFLSIYRFAKGSPGLLVIENPTYNLDMADRLRMINYLQYLSYAKFWVLGIFHNADQAKAVASQIAYSEDGFWSKTVSFREG